MIYKNNIFALFLLIPMVSSCSWFQHKPIFMKFGADEVDTGHSPEFQKGWDDGCTTGETVYGNTWTKSFRGGYVRDPELVGNRAYESAWTDAYHWCRQSHNSNINNWDNDWWGLLSLE